MNILIAPNSFKECADSVSIVKMLADNFNNEKGFNLIFKPLTDGGDGFLAVCKSLFELNIITYLLLSDYNEQLSNYKVGYDEINKIIYIESAELFGMKTLSKNELNPLVLNSEMLGKILLKIREEADAGALNVEQVNIGVGGTATIDFGIGACSQLGLTLFDEKGNVIKPIPENFVLVESFEFSKIEFPFKINFIVDVDTSLLDEPGAIEIYGEQKGATLNDLKLIKGGIINLINLFSTYSRKIISSNFNGAGGGLASGFSLFYDAEIIPAREFINKNILMNINPEKVDAIITGEGRFDFQSFEGKGIGVILKLFENYNIPEFIICGLSDLPGNFKLPKNIKIIEIQKLFNSKDDSIKNIKLGLAKASELIKSELKH